MNTEHYKAEIAKVRTKMQKALQPLEQEERKIQKDFESEVNSMLSEEDKKKMGRPFVVSDLDEYDCNKSPFGHCLFQIEEDWGEECCVFLWRS